MRSAATLPLPLVVIPPSLGGNPIGVESYFENVEQINFKKIYRTKTETKADQPQIVWLSQGAK